MRVVKYLYHPSGDERIEIFQRDNGTFGFDLFKWDAEEQAWCQWHTDSHAVVDSAGLDLPPKAEDFFDHVPGRLIEGDDVRVRCSDLEIDFRATHRGEARFCRPHEPRSDSVPPRGSTDGQPMQPPSHAVITSHHSPCNLAMYHGD